MAQPPPASSTLQYTLTLYSLTQNKSTPTAEECLEQACFTALIKLHLKKKNDSSSCRVFSWETNSLFLLCPLTLDEKTVSLLPEMMSGWIPASRSTLWKLPGSRGSEGLVTAEGTHSAINPDRATEPRDQFSSSSWGTSPHFPARPCLTPKPLVLVNSLSGRVGLA